MSALAASHPSATAPGPKPAPAPPEPAIRGESSYDRVTSMLMAIVVGSGLVVGWLSLIYLTDQAYQRRVAAPLEIVEVFGGGGGSPDGTPGSVEKIDIAGADAAAKASNNEEAAADFEEPGVEATKAAMVDSAAAAGETLAEVDLGAVVPSGGSVASGRRASKLGKGGPGLGFGPGDGGVPAEQRWSIVYDKGQTIEEYARQLDFFGVEMGVVVAGQMIYVSKFSSGAPQKRGGAWQQDDRLYFLWQGSGRKEPDVAILRKAGIEPGDAPLFHFYPKGVERALAQFEVRYKGRQPAEIRATRFGVVPGGNGYTFKVLDQVPLR